MEIIDFSIISLYLLNSYYSWNYVYLLFGQDTTKGKPVIYTFYFTLKNR